MLRKLEECVLEFQITIHLSNHIIITKPRIQGKSFLMRGRTPLQQFAREIASP
jgi:hypothetical protein